MNTTEDIFEVLGVERRMAVTIQNPEPQGVSYSSMLTKARIEKIALEEKIRSLERVVELEQLLKKEISKLDTAIEQNQQTAEAVAKECLNREYIGFQGMKILKALAKEELKAKQIADVTGLTPAQVYSWYYWHRQKGLALVTTERGYCNGILWFKLTKKGIKTIEEER